MRAWLLAALVILPLFASGAAHAQSAPVSPDGVPTTLSVAVSDPGHPMKPGKNESLDILVAYVVPAGGIGTPAPDPNADPTASQKTHVTFAAKKLPSWVLNVTFDPDPLNLTPPSGASGSTIAHATAILVIDPRAPALDKQEFVISAKSDKNGDLAAAQGESPPINLKPAFVGKANVTAPTSAIVPGGRWTDLPFTVKNLGNGETSFLLNVTARPQNSQVDYPTRITLARDASKVVNVRVRVPWTGAESGTVEFEATPLPPDDNSDAGRPSHADVDVIGQSAVPGASVLGTLALVVLVGILRRR